MNNFFSIFKLNHETKVCEYKCVEIPIRKIKWMMSKDIWQDSLEEEEVEYNLDHNLYSEKYTKKVKKLITKYNIKRWKFMMNYKPCKLLLKEFSKLINKGEIK